MDKMPQNIVVTEGALPGWARLLGWISLLGGAFFFYKEMAEHMISEAIIVALATANLVFMFWLIINVKFDLVRHKFKKEYTVGVLKFGLWKPAPQIEYVSVFKQFGTNNESDRTFLRYNVNVWYDTSKHFTIYDHPDKKQSYSMAYSIAEQLNVDLLDATVPNDFKWIEITTPKEPVS